MRYVWLAASGMLLTGAALQAQQTKSGPPAAAPAAPALDPAHNRLDALLLQWEDKMKDVKSLSAEIIRTQVNKTFGTQVVFEGKAKYLKPNLALLEMHRHDKPNIFEKYICTGTYLYEFNQDNREVRLHELPPPKPGQVADDNFLAFMFGMKAEEAKRRYDLNLAGEDQFYYYVYVTPRFDVDKQDFQKAQIALLKSNFLPRQLTFIEPNGNRATWDLPSIELGARLNRNEFDKPALPPGWKMIRAPRTDDTSVKPRVIRPNQ
jgi:TIGR03009 family protein